MNSIRRELLLWQVGSVLVAGLLLSAVTYQLAWHGFNRVRDYGLEQIARSILRHGVRAPDAPRLVKQAGMRSGAAPAPQAMTGTAETLASEEAAALEPQEDLGQFASQIWRLGVGGPAQLLVDSVDAGGLPLQAMGLHGVDWGGERWRVYTVSDGQQAVQVAVTEADRVAAFLDLVPWLLLPLAGLVVVLGALIHAAAGRALAPLARLSAEVASRDPGGLLPLPTARLPEELTPLVQALNALMARSDALLDSQRRFVADAAHALNTPLAAVRLQAQLAQRAPDEERPARLAELTTSVDRATHLVRQLLRLAATEPEDARADDQVLRLDEAAGRTVAAFDARADSLGVDLGVVLQPGTQAATLLVRCGPHALQLLLDNLLDNALRHAPPDSAVDLRLQRRADTVLLEVVDHGCGIPVQEHTLALQRFVRLPSAVGEGSGLGLSIVASIAAHSQAQLELDETPGGGLTVRVIWPAAAQAGA